MAASVKNWMGAKGVQMLEHTPYLPDPAPGNFFLFRRVKEVLVGTSLNQKSIRNPRDRLTRTITAKK
jgi:hypothetical protein